MALSAVRLADLIGAEGRRGVDPESDVTEGVTDADVNELRDAAGEEDTEDCPEKLARRLSKLGRLWLIYWFVKFTKGSTLLVDDPEAIG